LILGGGIANTEEGERLQALGVAVVSGIKAAMSQAKERIAKLGADYRAVAELEVGAR
jgi:hypothetical protein